MRNKAEKCVHGVNKDFCCLCNYGHIQQDKSEKTHKDTVSLMHMSVGSRINRGFLLLAGTLREI